jgi:hypothetical protein
VASSGLHPPVRGSASRAAKLCLPPNHDWHPPLGTLDRLLNVRAVVSCSARLVGRWTHACSRLLPTPACLRPARWSSSLSVCYVAEMSVLPCGMRAERQGHSLVSQSSYAALSLPETEKQETRFQVTKHPRQRLGALKNPRHPWPVPRAAGIGTGIDEAGSNYHLRLCSSKSRHLPATSLTNGALPHVCRCMIDGSVCSAAVEYGVRARRRLGRAGIWQRDL